MPSLLLFCVASKPQLMKPLGSCCNKLHNTSYMHHPKTLHKAAAHYESWKYYQSTSKEYAKLLQNVQVLHCLPGLLHLLKLPQKSRMAHV